MNQKTSPEVSNQEIQKAEQEEKTSGKWSRRSFLQAGSVGLSALAVSACTGNLDVLKKKLVLTQEIPDFTQYITTGLAAYSNGNPEFDPSKPITIIVDTLVKLTGNLTIPETMELVIRRHRGPKSNSQITTSTYPASNTPPNRIGNIFLNGYKLVIRGTFRASPFKVFEYKNPMHIFGESEGVRFGKDAVVRVDASWFGAEGVAITDVNTALDSTYPIQRAIDSALQKLEGSIQEYGPGHVFLHRGKYKITDTLHIFRNEDPAVNYRLPSFVFEGSGMGYQETQLYLMNKTDRPLINIQVTRHTIIRNLQLIGQNTQPAQEYATRRPEIKYWLNDPATQSNPPSGTSKWRTDYYNKRHTELYKNAGIPEDNPNWVSRYRPYCAIAIDGYVGRKNTTVTVPGYQDSPAEYYPIDPIRNIQYWSAGGGSQKTFIERVSIHKFGVGIAIAPGGTAQNDGHIIKECEIKNCALGISVGTSQARAVHVKNTDIYKAHTAVTNVTNGEFGTSLINLSSNQYLGCRTMYHLNPSMLGSCSIHGEYAENTLRIGTFGRIGAGGRTASVSFSGCNYRLESIGTVSTLGALVTGQASLHFQACTFQIGSNCEFSLHPSNPILDQMTFESCIFTFDDAIHVGRNDKINPPAPEVEYRENYVPHFRVFPGALVTLWGSIAQSIQFDNCSIPKHITTFPISNEVSVRIAPHPRVPATTPRRHPLHWSADRLRVHGGIYGEQTLQIKNTIDMGGLGSFVRFRATPFKDSSDDYTIWIKPFITTADELARYRPGDRFFIKMRYKGDDVRGADVLEAPLITLDDNGSGQVVWDSANEKMRASINRTDPSYRNDFELLPDKHKQGNLGNMYLYLRSDLNNPDHSQLYVPLNCTIKGQFTYYSPVVSVAENADLLQVGDFVNQEYVPHGTRIKSIDLTSTPPTFTMTSRAAKTSQGPDHVTALYIQGS